MNISQYVPVVIVKLIQADASIIQACTFTRISAIYIQMKRIFSLQI